MFPKILHFEEVAQDELEPALKLIEVPTIGLASAPSATNPIGACVLIYKGDANWSSTCVCFVIFFEKHRTF